MAAGDAVDVDAAVGVTVDAGVAVGDRSSPHPRCAATAAEHNSATKMREQIANFANPGCVRVRFDSGTEAASTQHTNVPSAGQSPVRLQP